MWKSRYLGIIHVYDLDLIRIGFRNCTIQILGSGVKKDLGSGVKKDLGSGVKKDLGSELKKDNRKGLKKT